MKSVMLAAAMVFSSLLMPASAKGAGVTSQDSYAQAKASKKSPTGATFSFVRNQENLTDFNLVISDGEEAVVSASFSLNQLEVLQSLLAEAKKFAASDDAAGVNEPVTTRFFDEHERALVIDVMKYKNQSRFFVTVKSQIGRLTVEAGNINRSNRAEEGFFSDLLSRIESELSRSRKPPVK
ncbi:MAG TPA: hypothetical protein VNI02_07405 [Blastocatellia bacterium]|jgi:hypothetical protein|nr:hypothetical protein [Blastocatellia bacterium]